MYRLIYFCHSVILKRVDIQYNSMTFSVMMLLYNSSPYIIYKITGISNIRLWFVCSALPTQIAQQLDQYGVFQE